MKRTVLTALVGASGVAMAQPASIDLGSLTGDTSDSGSIAPNEIVWYSFEWGSGATYIDITTTFDTDFDTEIGIYDSLGNLVANDDDNGVGLTSVLTFGAGSGQMLGDSFNLGGNGIAEGENGALPAPGTYYVALGEFNVDFNSTGWDVVSTGTDFGGNYTLTILTDIPAPGAATLLALGGLLASRRRR